MLIRFPFGFSVGESELAREYSKAAADEGRSELCMKKYISRDAEGVMTRLEGQVIDGGLAVVVVGHGDDATMTFATSNKNSIQMVFETWHKKKTFSYFFHVFFVLFFDELDLKMGEKWCGRHKLLSFKYFTSIKS